ncbi:MAG: hypothetical protein SWO11_13220 [Thermodesulfobacteriota bacterium]|nr:hypothetical protein [Thermodesulfobacteriota bacterium]
MSTVLPEGEDIRRAVKWVSQNLKDDPDQTVQRLVNDAILRFDISPKDAEFLTRFFSRKDGSEG